MPVQVFTPAHQTLLALYARIKKKESHRNLHPGTKYFLVKYLQSFPTGESGPITVRAMMKRFKVTDRVISRGLQELQEAGWIEGTKRYEASGASAYRCSSLLLELLTEAKENFSPSPWAQIIEHCLEPSLQRQSNKSPQANSSSVNASTAGHKLNISQRLLLITLLFHANECGVVRNLGKARLCDLTNFSRDRLQSQLESLKENGYLEGYESGGTYKELFGKVTGIYFLNIGHNLFRLTQGGDSVPRSVGIESTGNHEREICKNIATIVAARKALSKKYSGRPMLRKRQEEAHQRAVEFATASMYPGFPYEAAICYLPNSATERRLFQMKLDEYACLALNNHFESLTLHFQVSEAILQRVQQEAIANRYGPPLAEEMSRHLTRFICHYAVQQAVILKSAALRHSSFRSTEGVHFEFRRTRSPHSDGQLLVAYSTGFSSR